MVWVVNGDMVWSILALSGLVLKDSQDYLVSEYLGFHRSSDDSYISLEVNDTLKPSHRWTNGP